MVLVPGLLVVGLLVWWSADGGGYAATTWQPSALAVLGLLVATVVGVGVGRVRRSRAATLSLAALAGYVAWSYLSIAWAASPGDALDGSNRALLFLLLFALFAVLPWRSWTALAALTAYALAIGTLALVTLIRLGSDAAPTLFIDGRLVSPLGYVNATAALFLIGTIVSIALASRRELPWPLRPVLLALATACCQVAVLCQSRGWLFALPVVLVLAVVLMPGRVRLVLWTLPPLAGALATLTPLLDVFERSDAGRAAAASHAATVSLRACAVVLVVALALALLDRRVAVPPRLARAANRIAAGLAVAAALAGIAVGLALTDGRPDRAIGDYWDRSSGYEASTEGSSRFALAGSNRPDFWRVALDATAANPIGGLGQDNWGDDYLRERRSNEQPRWTHSLELRLLAHTGIIGFALFAGFLAAALVAALRGRRRTPALANAAIAVALLPLVVWFVHGSIDWFWEVPTLSGVAFAFLGLATAVADGDSPPARATSSRRRVAATAAGAVAALLAAAAIALPYLAERELSRATATWREQPGQALARLERARDLNALSAQPDITAGVIAVELDRPALARRHLTAALQREPDNWFALLVRGLATSATGNRAAARADFSHARDLNPRDPLVGDALKRIGSRRPLTAAEAFASVRQHVRRLTGTDPER
jgi:tetratricopeptide (TPR) repeat protein